MIRASDFVEMINDFAWRMFYNELSEGFGKSQCHGSRARFDCGYSHNIVCI